MILNRNLRVSSAESVTFEQIPREIVEGVIISGEVVQE